SDNALYTLYNDGDFGYRPTGYTSSKLVHYLISNAYSDMISELDELLPSNVMYNIYVSNGTNKVFWCNSLGDWWNPLPKTDPVTISHCIVAMNLTGYSQAAALTQLFYTHIVEEKYIGSSLTQSDLIILFNSGYSEPLFDVILEVWNV
ncbi:MAG: hypothetical protein V1726_03420, partial [Methanobacteriota archaeon]